MQAIWDGIRHALGFVLAFFYGIIPNAGFAIIMLTVVVRLILFPLTAKQAKSMIAMQRAQPEIKKLQAKYKNDRTKLNEEMMKFYKENSINPLGGCLPLLAQTPIFIALYQTLREIQKFVPADSQMFSKICAQAADAAACKSPNLDFFGMNLALSAKDAHGAAAIPYYVLVAAVVTTAYFQQRQTMRNQTTVNTQMQIIGKVMPVFFGFISINLPAGVVLYFFTSNLWQMGQQEVVYRTIGRPGDAPKGTVEAKSSDSKKLAKGSAPKAIEETPAPKPSGVKGLFKSITPGAAAADPADGAADPESGSGNGKASGSAQKGSGSAQKGSGAGNKSSGGSSKKSEGASGASGAASAGNGSGDSTPATTSAGRRRNNRKRKR